MDSARLARGHPSSGSVDDFFYHQATKSPRRPFHHEDTKTPNKELGKGLLGVYSSFVVRGASLCLGGEKGLSIESGHLSSVIGLHVLCIH
jgi:hypothetical protein